MKQVDLIKWDIEYEDNTKVSYLLREDDDPVRFYREYYCRVKKLSRTLFNNAFIDDAYKDADLPSETHIAYVDYDDGNHVVITNDMVSLSLWLGDDICYVNQIEFDYDTIVDID